MYCLTQIRIEKLILLVKVEQKRALLRDIPLFKELVLGDNPSLRSNYRELADVISEKFNTRVTERDLLVIETPTLEEEIEDLKLIYKHCVT
jgi:hypothetical protein